MRVSYCREWSRRKQGRRLSTVPDKATLNSMKQKFQRNSSIARGNDTSSQSSNRSISPTRRRLSYLCWPGLWAGPMAATPRTHYLFNFLAPVSRALPCPLPPFCPGPSAVSTRQHTLKGCTKLTTLLPHFLNFSRAPAQTFSMPWV